MEFYSITNSRIKFSLNNNFHYPRLIPDPSLNGSYFCLQFQRFDNQPSDKCKFSSNQ